MLLVPLLQHHQHPYHGAVITGVLGQMLADQLVNELAAHDLARFQIGQAAGRHLLQRLVML